MLTPTYSSKHFIFLTASLHTSYFPNKMNFLIYAMLLKVFCLCMGCFLSLELTRSSTHFIQWLFTEHTMYPAHSKALAIERW